MAFFKATKQQAKLRMAIHGPSGSGKTRSALEIARHLVPGGRIALIDTERGSASKYADKAEFDVCELTEFHPDRLLETLSEANGYDIVIVDSLSHFWNGPGGLLELVDAETKRLQAKNGRADSFAAWKVADPIYRRMVQGLLGAPQHLIMTMRAKQEYVKEQDDRGKTTIRKVGMAPEMRDAFQYEADIEGMLDVDHNLVVGKTRCDGLDGKVFHKPGRELAEILRAWLSDGAPATERPSEPPPATPLESQLRQSVAEAESQTARAMPAIRSAIESADSEQSFKAAYVLLRDTRMRRDQRDELRSLWEERKEAWKAAQAGAKSAAEDAADPLPAWAGGPEDEERAAIQGEGGAA